VPAVFRWLRGVEHLLLGQDLGITNQDLVQLPQIMKKELNAAAIADGGL